MLTFAAASFEDWGWEDFGVTTAATPVTSGKRGRSTSPGEGTAGTRAKRGRGSRSGKTAGSTRGRGGKAAKPPPLAPDVGKKPSRGMHHTS